MRQSFFKKLVLIVFVLLVIVLVYLYSRPVPDIEPAVQSVIPAKTQAVSLPWPASGQAALGAQGYGVLETHNSEAPVSIASIAKVIAALAVLRQKPLAVGEQGPVITLDNQDLAFYNYYYLNNGSAAKVQDGEQITEYQALQAMLIPSGNNIADSLTRWAFGSQTAYAAYANKMLKDMGLSKTTVSGASGFADDAKSTADELVKVGLEALDEPVISQVVSQTSATVPVAGDIKSTNWLLGTDNVVGIKTGNTDQAGGCYLFASKRQIDGHDITTVGAILGAPSLTAAISSAQPLIKAADSGFANTTPVHKNQIVATYNTPWGDTANAVAGKNITMFAWTGADTKISNKIDAITVPAPAGSQVGKTTVKSSDLTMYSPDILSSDLSAPPWTWRLFR